MKVNKIFLSIICLVFLVFCATSCENNNPKLPPFEMPTENEPTIEEPTINNPTVEESTHVHDYYETEVISETCTLEGLITYTCLECGDVKYETIQPKGHTEVKDPAVDATCTETGLTEGKHCSVCDEVLISQQVVQTTSHNYESTVTKPTCTSKGYTTHTCKDCNHSYVSDTISSLSHSAVIDDAVDATCTNPGLTEGKHCSECNKVLIPQEVILPIHSYSNNTNIRECLNCGYNPYSYTSGLRFELSEDESSYIVTSYYSETNFNVVIPSIYNGKPVTAIDDHAFLNDDIVSITIPDSVTIIEEGAFDNCNSLSSISIGYGVEKIGEHALDRCNTYAYTRYGNGLYLGNNSNPYYAFIKPISTTITSCEIHPNTKVIADYAFYGCKSLTSVTIPYGITNISEGAFYECEYLTSVSLPDGLKSISYLAFNSCTRLESITIPDTVTIIEGGAVYLSYCDIYFSGTLKSYFNFTKIHLADYNNIYILDENNEWFGLRELNDIVIPDGVTTIGEGAFGWFSSLKSVTIPASVTSFGDYAFNYCSSLQDIYYKGSIEDWCGIFFEYFSCHPMQYATNFYMLDQNNEWHTVKEIVIPDSITTINNLAFYNWNSVETVIIGKNVKSIGYCAFYDCKFLSEIVIPNGVTNIDSAAFVNCSSLTNITLPNSIKNIGSEAFFGCNSLENVYYAGTEEQWREISIGGLNELLVYANITYNYGANFTTYYYNSEGWTAVYAYVWNDNGYLVAWPGEKLTIDGNGLYSYSVDANSSVGYNIIFNNGSGLQTGDIALDGTNFYFYGINTTGYLTEQDAKDAAIANADKYSIIGSGFEGSGSWTNDIYMTINSNGIYEGTIVVNSSAEFKIRKNSSWDVNYGGTLQGGNVSGTLNGANIILSSSGTYLITFNPTTKLITIAKQ